MTEKVPTLPTLPKLKRRLISRPKLVREILSELEAIGKTDEISVKELIADIKDADFTDRF